MVSEVTHVIRFLIAYRLTPFLEIHKNCFCTFIAVSETYMALTFYIHKGTRRDDSLSEREKWSLNLKKNLFIINLVSIMLAAYFFVRHNDHCEGGSEFE